ncbi:MAG TPA: FHA domain-containing protein [Actinomycetota bacterium]|nr:FHA domain-containing protein [Actinomycetota bacterium]
MSPFVLSVLKYALVALLYFFIFRALRSVAMDLSSRGRGGQAQATRAAKATKAKPPRGGRSPTALVLHAPEARKPRTFRLTDGLEIGRAEACTVRLEDTYASQHHARLATRDGVWMLEDMGSTNGTFLNDRRVGAPVEVHAGDVVKIGKTVLELRR